MPDLDAEKLARKLAALEDKVAALSRSRQVAYSTVEVDVPDEEGAPVAVSLPVPVAIQRGVEALYTTANLQEQIDGLGTGTQITSSPNAPTAADTAPEGSLWFQVDESNSIIGQWQMAGGAWEAQKIRSEVIANLDAGKITTGELSADRIGVDTLAGKTIIGGTIIGGTIEGEVEVSSGGGVVARSTSGQVARFATIDENGDLRMEMQESGIYLYPSGGGEHPYEGDKAWLYANYDGSGRMSLTVAANTGAITGDGDDGQIYIGYTVGGVTYDLSAQRARIGSAVFSNAETIFNFPIKIFGTGGVPAEFGSISPGEGGGWELGTALRVPNAILTQVRSDKFLNSQGQRASAYALAADTVQLQASGVSIANGDFGEVSVTFPVGRFQQPPKISLTGTSARLIYRYEPPTVTTTGFTLRGYNFSGAAAGGNIYVDWIATQMTPTSAGG